MIPLGVLIWSRRRMVPTDALVVSCDLDECQIANALSDIGLVPIGRLLGSDGSLSATADRTLLELSERARGSLLPIPTVDELAQASPAPDPSLHTLRAEGPPETLPV